MSQRIYLDYNATTPLSQLPESGVLIDGRPSYEACRPN